MNQYLSRLQKAWRRELLTQALLIALASLALAVAVATLFAHFGQTQWGLRAASAGFVLALLGLGWSHRVPFRPLEHSRHHLALLWEKLAPEAGSSPTSAVNFLYNSADHSRLSADLVNEHILQTEQLLAGVNFRARLSDFLSSTRKRVYLFGFASLLTCLLLTSGLQQGRKRVLHAFLNPNAVEISDIPLTGDIQLTYRYPAYTQKPPQIIEGGNGSIRALIGTEVELRARAAHTLTSARLTQFLNPNSPPRAIPVTVSDGRKLLARFTLLENSRYSFSLVTEEGESLQERKRHPIVALPDHIPEITMDSPPGDIEIRESDSVPILWHAKDDFGVKTVNLVIEPDAPVDGSQAPELIRIPLTRSSPPQHRREGKYVWKLNQLSLPPGKGAGFYLEAIDTDTINGPKRAVTPTYRLTVFSAQRHHEEILLAQSKVLDALVDWLGQELTHRLSPASKPLPAVYEEQSRLLGHIKHTQQLLTDLTLSIQEDELSQKGIGTAFEMVLTHTTRVVNQRTRLLKRLEKNSQNTNAFNSLRARQRSDVLQLEKDVIYLDDLLAIQRIEELKTTANELLSAQRDLQGLLENYRETKDPGLRKELQTQIEQLRNKMLDLLQKMSQIKQQLPGEYRNMEAGSMLKIDDQLSRLEQMLAEDDLEGAAEELEQLANMIEQMMDSIDDAEEEYGGERYEQIREQLDEFSHSFEKLEKQQAALSKRTNELLKEYRKKSLERAGDDLDDFIKRIRQLTGEAIVGLEPAADVSPPIHDPRRRLDNARQRLFDLDALLAERDFSEARAVSQQAQKETLQYKKRMDRQLKRRGSHSLNSLKAASTSLHKSVNAQQKVIDALDKLFPSPSEILGREQLEQLKGMAQKQSDLQREADELGARMQSLAQDVPLFGKETQENLQNARSQMRRAHSELDSAELPNAASSERKALEQLGKLREALQEATKSSKGGLPMPLGGSSGSSGRPNSRGRGVSKQDVEIPQIDSGRASPRFRKELLDAAKQRAPERYKEAVRQYYEELIK